jgi:selenocysteine lyase/cysteine desulfurase
MLDRRAFLGAIGYPTAALSASAALGARLAPRGLGVLAALAGRTGPPEEIAKDESFWFAMQEAFTLDRSLLNLNNGAVCPSPAIVQESMKRYLDLSNTAPAYVLWQLLEPRKETVRGDLARLFGCDPEEIAITRNASEGLQIAQAGLDLQRGDEVLTTNQDYPRMITTWKQRERRDGIVLKQFSIPVPCEDPERIVRLFEEGISPRTRVILMCHVINLTGQVLPVRRVVAMARERGIPVLVDGAHAFAHLVFSQPSLNCDYYATSLHKWLLAPHGTGMLYVRKDKIRSLWPLQAAPPEMDENIRKFEEIGTHPAANTLAIAEAIVFHQGIGPERKEARLRYLRDYWARRLQSSGKVRLHTSLRPEFSAGIGTFQLDGAESGALNQHLWNRHRIFTATIKHAEFEGIRVTPNVYTTLEDLDRFCEAVEDVIRKGLPKA